MSLWPRGARVKTEPMSAAPRTTTSSSSEDDTRGYVGAGPEAVAAAEIRSLKPSARVYEKRTPNIFFLSTRAQALDNIEQRLRAEEEEKQRH